MKIMENKCCCNHENGVNVCVHVDGCGLPGSGENPEVTPCACVPNLKITIGEGGQFGTLTEALEYAGTVVHNTLVIEMVSDVVEMKTDTIKVSCFELKSGYTSPATLVLKGNGHVLNLNRITGVDAILFHLCCKVSLNNVTILAQNALGSAIGVGNNGFLTMSGTTIVGNSSSPVDGITATWSGNVSIGGNSVLRNFRTGINALHSSTVCVGSGRLTFENVKTNYSPSPGTIGNENASIHII